MLWWLGGVVPDDCNHYALLSIIQDVHVCPAFESTVVERKCYSNPTTTYTGRLLQLATERADFLREKTDFANSARVLAQFQK